MQHLGAFQCANILCQFTHLWYFSLFFAELKIHKKDKKYYSVQEEALKTHS